MSDLPSSLPAPSLPPTPRTLDAAHLDLHGVQLIEASAGTGKTWTIAALYLRLLLEHAFPVEKILVVTYTNAATAELRARIRERLLEAQHALAAEVEEGALNHDPILAAILQRTTKARVQVLLTLALESFDLAAIYTIHGFCQRALAERAFESGLPFEAELASDDRQVLYEAMEDFWRLEIARHPEPYWLGWLLDAVAGPAALLAQLRPHFGKPYLVAVPAPAWNEAAIENFSTAVSRTKILWDQDSAAACALLQAHGGLHATYYKPEKITSLFASLDTWFASARPGLPLPKNFEHLTAHFIEGKTKAKNTPPEHGLFFALEDVFAQAAALEQAFQHRLGELQQRALAECEASIRKTRQRLGTRSFDDLLLDLHAALVGESGPRLAASLRSRYAAALIDEFQDTDPLQYDIFAHVFAPQQMGGRVQVGVDENVCPLFFVGDPKQAIYSFRGADLRAYLQARQRAGEPLTLDTNRRSTPELVGAVNALFAQQTHPFLDEALHFSPVAPPPNPPPPLLLNGESLPALALWWVPRDDSESSPKASGPNKGKRGVIAKNRATPAIAEAVASTITDYLAAARRGELLLGDRPLAGQDIAVLVKSHYQGQQVREALLAHGIASVHYGQDSVFDTLDALEIERVLLAIAHPTREGLVRAALASSLMGMAGDALAQLDANTWLQWLADFQRWHVLARDYGFIRLWRTWLIEADVPARLLALPDGERRMTNLLHVSDMLATVSHDEGLGVEALAKYLADARYDERTSTGGEGRLLRLESDENLVRIVTIHTSKGLEYPVTFCPFLWDAAQKDRPGPVRFHDPAQAHQAALDFGSALRDEHAALASHEASAEALRLAYVALTRAKQQCVLVWGAMKDAESSPLAWLLHGSEALDFGAFSDDELKESLNPLLSACPDIALSDLPAPSEDVLALPNTTTTFIARALPARSLLPWRMHSFTAWAANPNEVGVVPGLVSSLAELPDHDMQVVPLLEADVVVMEEDAEGAPNIDVETPNIQEAHPQLQLQLETPLQQPLLKSLQEQHLNRQVSDFPRGANAGTCLHAMFERADFAAPESAVIQGSLLEFGFATDAEDLTWQDTAMSLVHDVLHTPLSETLPPLAMIPFNQQVREMEFLLPVGLPDMAALARAVGPNAGADGKLAERIRTLQPAMLAGFLKGFVDLVFAHEGRYYVVDYKSNWLGGELQHYSQAHLAAAMSEALYDLQALLYGVALHHALAQRLPDYDYDQHCGGSLYLFLRGMQPALAGSGVFAWRPDSALIERVAECLATKVRVFAC